MGQQIYNEAMEILTTFYPTPYNFQPPEHFKMWDEFIDVTPPYYMVQNKNEFYTEFWNDCIQPKHKKAYDMLLESATTYHNLDAYFQLAQINLWNDYRFIGNKTQGLHYLLEFEKYSSAQPNGTVLYQIACCYSTGLFEREPDQLRALAYLQRGAEIGEMKSIQALAYRYSQGISTEKNLDKALLYYSRLSELIYTKLNNTYPNWELIPNQGESYNLRIPDLQNKLVGEEALSTTRSSTIGRMGILPSDDFFTDYEKPFQVNRGKSGLFQVHSNIISGEDDDEGNDDLMNDIIISSYYLAVNAYYGTYVHERNHTLALLILENIYSEYDNYTATISFDQMIHYKKCLTLLGHMYMRGDGLDKPNMEKAAKILERKNSVNINSYNLYSPSNIDLALINYVYYKNSTKAKEICSRIVTAGADNGRCSYYLLKMGNSTLNHITKDVDIEYLQKSATIGYVPAIYYLAKFRESKIINGPATEDKIHVFKRFVHKAESVMVPYLKKSFNKLMSQDFDGALWGYALAAEQGYEEAQTSLAYILYQPPTLFSTPAPLSPIMEEIALSYYIRAYKQNNPDAAIVAGNIYYKRGDYNKAVALYQGASSKFSLLGMWNLGYMYEYGLGVQRDFHLAKRYYEQVLAQRTLFFGIKLTVLKLQLKEWYYSIVDSARFAAFYNFCGGNDNASVYNKIKHFLQELYEKSMVNLKSTCDKYFFLNTNPKIQVNVYSIDGSVIGNSNGNVSHNYKNFFSKAHKKINHLLQEYGLFWEDIISIVMIVSILMMSFFARILARRFGWNLQENNRNEININGGDGNLRFRVQFFAI
ncbi:ubiquitin ligase complex subunit HRD3 SCDLUD_000238 [Saccharomycodes ludwigii]|uniref:ubiquitin ligase complex subunit HRD3 n=1 Tax=Saccharomycodes ludwigii TaxID=36035 RepID=UPI001E8B462E|nr:hypothetical protein SCDLUD_000238 [Saccharomycodes ludwigii]KAH3902656.1 hypothetical protein SCDLUD_000238 [Saccharomycodes ludwigii]